jgi:hypothetical protein
MNEEKPKEPEDQVIEVDLAELFGGLFPPVGQQPTEDKPNGA